MPCSLFRWIYPPQPVQLYFVDPETIWKVQESSIYVYMKTNTFRLFIKYSKYSAYVTLTGLKKVFCRLWIICSWKSVKMLLYIMKQITRLSSCLFNLYFFPLVLHLDWTHLFVAVVCNSVRITDTRMERWQANQRQLNSAFLTWVLSYPNRALCMQMCLNLTLSFKNIVQMVPSVKASKSQ